MILDCLVCKQSWPVIHAVIGQLPVGNPQGTKRWLRPACFARFCKLQAASLLAWQSLRGKRGQRPGPRGLDGRR